MMPATLWRGGRVVRGVIVGLCLGLFFGVLAWLDAGMALAGAVVFVVVGVGSGVWVAVRSRRFWPGADELTGDQRMTVVSAARHGSRVGGQALTPAVIDYVRGLHAAAETRRLWRWLVVALLVIAIGMAVWDAVAGSVGNVVVSVVYLALLCVELFWWPARQVVLLHNADRAAALSRPTEKSD